MYMKTVLSLAGLFSIASSLPTTFVKNSAITRTFNDIQYIPSDNGGNFGDYLWGTYENTQAHLQEILINPIQSRNSQWIWTFYREGIQISYMRFMNIGRERAYVESVTLDSYNATAVINIPAEKQFRLLVQVFGL